ncbi:hypothetical protein OROGR_016587 [Orobanche gracilis]
MANNVSNTLFFFVFMLTSMILIGKSDMLPAKFNSRRLLLQSTPPVTDVYFPDYSGTCAKNVPCPPYNPPDNGPQPPHSPPPRPHPHPRRHPRAHPPHH